MIRRSPLALVLLGLAAAPAGAAIPNFSFNGITGVGELDGALDDRLGTAVNATDHVINIDDCQAYAGGTADWGVKISPLPSGDWQYAAAYAPPNKTCATTDANPEATDGGCTVPKAQRELTDTSFTFRVDFDSLIGKECDSGTEGTATIYVIVENPGVEVNYETIDVDVDLKAPTAPVITSVVGGDGRFEVAWTDDVNDSADVTYTVYWDETDFTADALGTAKHKSGIDTTSVAIESSSVENGAVYFVRVTAVDQADNVSALSDSLTVTPEATQDFWEGYQAAGGTDPGGYCFVATAAWGTPLAGELDTLRRFRDDVLMQSAGGRAFVADYYRWGRFAAAWIADKPALRAVARVLLTPLLWLAKLMLWAGPLAGLFLLGAGVMGLAALRRRWLTRILRDVPLEAR
ncbi:MAG: hypothetical protein CVU56_24160 [Deltaproteobacteria bacterium HGW-Deltaproteobacteria-14]|jgi:hypothetical protein|nr:MAG: hypothetical protein CVU56_24160 [Deltaproteobacteria bacterium HGW-Deltaproteobacteria-14]